MKTALVAVALLFTSPAFADPVDDYFACLIGQAAVALNHQTEKDAQKAQEVAYSLCTEPEDFGSADPSGFDDAVNEAVEAMATTF